MMYTLKNWWQYEYCTCITECEEEGEEDVSTKCKPVLVDESNLGKLS